MEQVWLKQLSVVPATATTLHDMRTHLVASHSLVPVNQELTDHEFVWVHDIQQLPAGAHVQPSTTHMR
jgi:hypothetical protein